MRRLKPNASGWSGASKNAKDALSLAESDLDNLAQGSAEDSDAGHADADEARADAEAKRDQLSRERADLAQALADADAGLERAERGRLRATCFGEREAQRWTAAVGGMYGGAQCRSRR